MYYFIRHLVFSFHNFYTINTMASTSKWWLRSENMENVSTIPCGERLFREIGLDTSGGPDSDPAADKCLP